MAVDLEKLPNDEEWLRQFGNSFGEAGGGGRAIQNVLDALNWYRCKYAFADQERKRAEKSLARVNEELIEVRNASHNNRIFRHAGC